MPQKKEDLPQKRKATKKNSIVSIQNQPASINFLPSLDADLQIQYYAGKLADSEIARSEIAECHTLVAQASHQLDAMKAQKLKNTIAESVRFLGWGGGSTQ